MKSFYIYVILWVGSCLIAALITVLLSDEEKRGNTILFDDTTIKYNTDQPSNNIVNKLLLSAEELKLSGTILVIPGYKHASSEGRFLNPVYSRILKRKLEKASQPLPSIDFTIKPLPKND